MNGAKWKLEIQTESLSTTIPLSAGGSIIDKGDQIRFFMVKGGLDPVQASQTFGDIGPCIGTWSA